MWHDSDETEKRGKSDTAMCSLLYISRSLLPANGADAIVHAIVAEAIMKNAPLAITGALIFTGTHFAQIIEGGYGPTAILFEKIANDNRHDMLKVVQKTDISERRFANWSLAYMGPSQFVSRHLNNLLRSSTAQQEAAAAAWISDLMAEFVASP